MAVIKARPSSHPINSTTSPTNFQDAEKSVFQKINEWNIPTEPLDIELLIRKYGIIVSREEMDMDLSGYIEQRHNFFVIGINQYQNARRQRFTLAHEFAHFILDRDAIIAGRIEDRIMLRSQETNQIEKRASTLAAELLMPKDLFRQRVNDGVRDFSDLAEVFDVSIAAARYRAFTLNYISSY